MIGSYSSWSKLVMSATFTLVMFAPIASFAAKVTVDCVRSAQDLSKKEYISNVRLEFDRESLGRTKARFVLQSNGESTTFAGIGSVKSVNWGGSRIWTVSLEVQHPRFQSVGIDLEQDTSPAIGAVGLKNLQGEIVGATVVECKIR